MSNLKKKEVYIPVEIKPREFVSNLLLSGELAKIGFRVYLGSKKTIDNLINNKENHGGIYFYKGGGGTVDKFREISKKVESIAVLDQEVSPTVNNYGMLKSRFVKGSLKFVSRLYYIGDEAKKTAIELLDEIDSSKIKALGWPRVDLWRPSLHHIWLKEIEEIKSRFPEPYILFTSDFGVNSKNLLHECTLRMEKRGSKKPKNEIQWYKNLYKNNYKKFNEFIYFITELSKDKETPKIIIRPHPAEDHSVWHEIGKNLSNIEIIYEGDVSPWLLASEGLLHRGCTSAIEALFSKKKIGFLSNFSAESENQILKNISENITDIGSLKSWFKDTNKLSIENPDIYALVKKHVILSNKTAASKIATDMQTLSKCKVSPAHIYEISIKRNKLTLRNIVIKLMNKIYKKKSYVPKFYKKNKMQNGITLEECKHYLNCMFPESFLNIESTSPQLFKIES